MNSHIFFTKKRKNLLAKKRRAVPLYQRNSPFCAAYLYDNLIKLVEVDCVVLSYAVNSNLDEHLVETFQIFGP